MKTVFRIWGHIIAASLVVLVGLAPGVRGQNLTNTHAVMMAPPAAGSSEAEIEPVSIGITNFAQFTMTRTGNIIEDNATARSAPETNIVRGFLKRELYLDINGITVDSLTDSAKFPDRPDQIDLIPSFEAPSNIADNYGIRLSGFIRPPVSGDYVFYIASDDQGCLYLSTDESPDNKALIAFESSWSMPREWTRNPMIRDGDAKHSASIRLVAGQDYYVEVLMKEGGGGDNCAVAWQKPGDPVPQNGSPPIPGEYLATYWPSTQNPGGDRELHVVGIYSGTTSSGSASRNNEQGDAAVAVNRPGKFVTLFLSSYEPVNWHITTSPGSTIEKVILSGYYPQGVEGLPANTEIVRLDISSGYYLHVGYEVDSAQFLASVPKLHAMTGLEIASFHGQYQAPYPSPFVLDSIDIDPRLRSDYPQPVPLSELPNLSFQLSFDNGGTQLVRKYTLAGPQNAALLLPSMPRAFEDPGQGYYYRKSDNGITKIYTSSGTSQEISVGSDLPELSWPMGITFDTLRRRVLLVSLGGEGFLYAYSPAQNHWSVVSSMDNRDFYCLQYHPSEDAFYGISTDWGDSGHPVIYRLSANGAYLGEIKLPVLPYGIGNNYQAELASVGDYLVLLLQSNRLYADVDERGDSRMYLIEPKTGNIWLAYRQIGMPPNKPPTVRLTSPVDGATFVAGTPIEVGALASDPDGLVQSVEFYANNQRLESGGPPDMEIQGSRLSHIIWTPVQAGAYTLTAKAIDEGGAVTLSDPVHITVAIVTNIITTIRRELPASYVPGVQFTVRIQVPLLVNSSVYAVEDCPPANWRISHISHGGVFDPVTLKVKFGPYFDNSARTLAYDVKPPLNADGIREFAGTISVDGKNQAIGGDHVINSKPSGATAKLSATARNSDGSFKLTVTGPPGRAVAIMISSDLLHWSRLAHIENANGMQEYVDSTGPSDKIRFYRIVPAE